MSGAGSLIALGTAGGPPQTWPPPPREPLPPFPQPTSRQPAPPEAGCWTYTAFNSALPFTPPQTPTLDFHRGNVCGHRVDGAPTVPGGCSDGSLIFTWFLYEYPEDWQDQILDSYQAAGYTHIDFHRAAWMGRLDGVPGCSKDVALDQVRKCVARGLYVIVNLAIDNGAPDPAELTPWIDDLIGAGMQIGCLAWQADQRMSPFDWCNYIAWAAPYLHDRGAKVSAQYMNSACAWWDPADAPTPSTCSVYGVCDRFSFQAWTAGKIDYPYQQFNTEAPVLDDRPREGGMQGEIQNVLASLVSQKLVACEYDYQAEYDHPDTRWEIYGDLKGRSLMATSYQGKYCEGGYLGGCRQPDGSVL